MKVRSYRLVLGLICLLVFVGGAAGAVPNGPSPSLVISQVYGGGGNSGAVYTHDYIEIFNRGTTSVSLAGKSLQYTSAAGPGNLGSASNQLTELPSVTLLPGQYFLVQEAPGAGPGTPVPADFVDPTPIPMSATAGKVALANGTTSLGCNTAVSCATTGNDTRIIDLVGYGGATYFEGAGPAPLLTNTTAAFRTAAGCQDTDNNAADFTAASASPRNTSSTRNFCSTDAAPFVVATTPPPGSTENPTTSNITVTFSEPVVAQPSAFSLNCTLSGNIALTVTPSGASTTYLLDPQTDLQRNETCTVTVAASGVTDVDEVDPPDNMAGNYSFSFTTVGLALRIYEIQGASHISPYNGQLVSGVPGVITAVRPNSLYIQDAVGDGIDATSDAILVFRTGIGVGFAPGQAVLVSGRVTEFRPGGAASNNLTTTEIVSPTVILGGPGAIAPTVVGQGGRVPPTTVIEDDASGSVETSGTFDPVNDGIDYYESMEAMLLQVNDGVVTGPRNRFGEVWVLADDGANAFLRTTREGIVVRRLGSAPYPHDYEQGDFNPERIQLEDDIVRGATPAANVGDHFTSSAVGVLDYNFGNFELQLTSALTRVDEGLTREVTDEAKKHELTVATFNVENLDPTDLLVNPEKFAELASLIVNNMRAPDVLAIEEIQDNDGPTSPAPTDASVTWGLLIDAIEAEGGPTYDYRQIDPLSNTDGGEPNGNIRVGFLFRTDVEDLTFVDRPGGTAVTANAVVETKNRAHLLYSPGRIDPTNPAFNNSRKPLAGEFVFRHRPLFLIANHFNSKGGDQPLFGRFQPPARSSEVQRHQQAQIVNNFVDQILAVEPKANVVVLGDLNDFEFSTTLDLLEGGVLTTLIETLPPSERYTYVFEGNSQSLDHILVSDELAKHHPGYDVVHVNAEFAQQASDHDPQVAQLDVHGPALP